MKTDKPDTGKNSAKGRVNSNAAQEGVYRASFEEAVGIRDLLIKETGVPYMINMHRGGFEVVRSSSLSEDPPQEGVPPPQDQPPDNDKDAIRLYRAWRGRWHYGVVVVVSTIGFLFANTVPSVNLTPLVDTFPAVSSVVPATFNSRLVLQSLCVAVSAVLLLSWAYYRYSTCYIITPTALRKIKGIMPRRQAYVRLCDVRAVWVNRPHITRLFNLGDVEFATAGTNEKDFAFRTIKSPLEIERKIQGLISQRRAKQWNRD